MSLIIILALIFVQDFADFLDENSDKVVKLGVNQQCNSATSICSASIINEGEFQRISFTVKGAAANSEFPIKDKSTHQVVPENWHAVVKLPNVENGRSDWLAIVYLKSSAREYRAEFPCSF
jgi:hypothetical protein